MKGTILNIREFNTNKGRELVFKSFIEAAEKKGIKVYDGFDYKYNKYIDDILSDSNFVLYREDQIKNKIHYIRNQVHLLNERSSEDYSGLLNHFIKFSKKTYHQLKSVFGKKTQFLIGDPKENLSDKWNAVKLAKKMKIRVPFTFLANKIGVNNLCERLKYPFVAKHKISSSGRGNKKINNELDLLDQIMTYGTNHDIYQELIKGPLYKKNISGYIRVVTFGGNTKNQLNVLGAQAVYNLDNGVFVNKNGAETSIALTRKNRKKKLSKNEAAGLYACGLEKIEAPDEILRWSSKLGAAASEQGSQFNTIDFSYNQKDSQFYFLGDINKFPGFGCLNSLFGTYKPNLKERITEAGKILADKFEKCFCN